MITGFLIFFGVLALAGLAWIGAVVVIDHVYWLRIRRQMARCAEAPVPGRPRLGIDREAGRR